MNDKVEDISMIIELKNFIEQVTDKKVVLKVTSVNKHIRMMRQRHGEPLLLERKNRRL